MITLYGIRNCGTMKKAFTWLDEQGIEWQLHDFRRQGVDPKLLRQWAAALGWRTLLNTRGTTWRRLTAEQQADMTAGKAVQLMEEYPSLIRRPVLEANGRLVVGFEPAIFASVLRG